jgi:hypothetical protein
MLLAGQSLQTIERKGKQDVTSLFARKQKLSAAIPMDPTSQCLQESLLLDKSINKKYTTEHEKAEEDLSHVVLVASVFANIQIYRYSYLLGLMITFFNASSAFSAHVLTLTLFLDDANPGMAALFSIMRSCATCAINTLGFFYVSDRLIYSL